MEVLNMKIENKIYRNFKSIKSFIQNDVQNGKNNYEAYIYFYLKDNKVFRSLKSKKELNENEFPLIKNKIIRNGIENRFNNDNSPISVGEYKISESNEIEMKWNFFYDGESEILFKGQILLSGNAIKGTLYKNGEISVPCKVYYNIDKPLPNPLIPEEGEDIV